MFKGGENNFNVLQGMKIGGKHISNIYRHTFDEDSYNQKIQIYQRNRMNRSKNSVVVNDPNELNRSISQMNLVIQTEKTGEKPTNEVHLKTADIRTIDKSTDDFRIYSQGLQYQDADKLFEGMEIH